jgi:hypothetical protein
VTAIAVYAENTSRSLLRKVQQIIEKEFGALLPFPESFVREQFPLRPVVEKKGNQKTEEIVIHVGNRVIEVSRTRGHDYSKYNQPKIWNYDVKLKGSGEGWGQRGRRRESWYGKDQQGEDNVVRAIYAAIEKQEYGSRRWR